MTWPQVIGHRGAAESAPENTLESFRAAKNEGAGWVEFDAKLTADNQIILLHDDDLDRTTTGKGPAKALTLAQYRALDAGSWFGAKWRGVKVPTLEEAVALFREIDLRCNLEIKPCPGRDRETAEVIMTELRRIWPRDRDLPLISSFSLDSLKAAQATAPEFSRGLLLENHPAGWHDLAISVGAVSVNCWERDMTPAWAREIKEAGYGLLVYTVNDPARAKELMSWGVDGVFTDAPGRLLTALGI